jgi:hypothetical protein
MSWTDPKTWQTGEALTASDMNTHIKDNLNALKAPPTAHYECDEVSDYSTTSTSFVDIDATNLSLTIVTTGGDVLIGHYGVYNNASGQCQIDVEMDDTRLAANGNDGMLGWNGPTTIVHLVSGLSAETHVFKLQWRVTAGQGWLYAGSGLASSDFQPQFWVREV